MVMGVFAKLGRTLLVNNFEGCLCPSATREGGAPAALRKGHNAQQGEENPISCIHSARHDPAISR